MENLNVRRNFLKGVSLLGVAAGGFLAAQNSFANTPPPTPIGSSPVGERDIGPVEDIAHLAPLGKTSLQLTADNIPPPPPPPPQPAPVGGYGFDGNMITGSFYPPILTSGYKETDNKVTLSVGRDDRLWIKIGDTWRRVALEG